MYNRKRNQNLERVALVAERLGDLLDQVVFLGGAITGLLVTDPAAPDIRATLDVDIIVQAVTRLEYYSFHEKLREKGFQESTDEGVICRWKIDGLLVDVMPVDGAVFGFANRWYSGAIAHPEIHELEAIRIHVIAAPYFLGTKLDAFHDRGQGDFLSSHDIEDLVAVLDGRPRIVEEVRSSEADLLSYLATEFGKLLSDSDFLDALPGHLPPDKASQQRIPILLDRFRKIALLKK